MTSHWDTLWSGAASADSDKDRWATPANLFDRLHAEFSFGLDAAALACNCKVSNYLGPDHSDPTRRDALATSWAEASGGQPVWCNPPYSAAGKFAQVAQREAEAGLTSALLVFARTDTRWWWKHVLGRNPKDPNERVGMAAAEIRWRPGRICFLDPLTGAPRRDKSGRPQSAPAPSVLIIYRPGFSEEWPCNGVLT